MNELDREEHKLLTGHVTCWRLNPHFKIYDFLCDNYGFYVFELYFIIYLKAMI